MVARSNRPCGRSTDRPLSVSLAGSVRVVGGTAAVAAIPSARTSTMPRRPPPSLRARYSPPLAAAILPHWPTSTREKWCSTWGPEGDRCSAVGKTRRPDGEGLRPGHDRRDARPGAREPTQGRGLERRVPEGGDRAHPAPGWIGGRDHLELRDQPL